MQFSHHRNRKGMWRVALALTVAAVAAPVGQATSFEDRVGSSHQFYANSSQTDLAGLAPTASESNEWVKAVTSLSPEALVATFGTGPALADGSAGPDAFMRYFNNHVGAAAPQSSPEAQALGRYADSVTSAAASKGSPKAVAFDSRPHWIGSSQVVETGFQWDDAAIGGGFGLGLMLLAGAAFLATRHISRPITV